MAEIFGAVASGAGLLSLAIQLLEKAESIRSFYGRTKNAPETLLNIGHQLETVSLLLQELEKHRQHDGYDASLLLRCISQCQHFAGQMERLVSRLQSRLSRLHFLGKVMVALRDDECAKLLSDLEQAKSSIMLAFQMYTFSRQIEQDQRRSHEFTQFRSEASFGAERLLTEIHELRQLTALHPRNSHSDSHSLNIYSRVCTDPDEGNGQIVQAIQNVQNIRRLPEKRKKQHQKSKYSFKINSSWLTGKIWHVAATRAENGWDFHARTWNLRPHTAEIFRLCEQGDVLGVRQMLEEGTASAYDLHAPNWVSHRGDSLLEISSWCGHLDLCRYLIEETSLSHAGVAATALDRWLDGEHFHLASHEPASIYRLMIEKSDFDPDLDDILDPLDPIGSINAPRWIQECRDADSIKVIQQGQSSDFHSWPALKRIQYGVHAYRYRTDGVFPSKEHLMLDWMGLDQVTPELASFELADGFTPLHIVARAMAVMIRDRDLERHLNHLARLAQDLIHSGANVSAVGAGRTPFIEFLSTVVGSSRPHCCHEHLDTMIKDALHLWRGIITFSGVELRSYASIETARMTWMNEFSKGICPLFFRRRRKEYIKFSQMISDETAEQWSLNIKSTIVIQVFSKHLLPGSWKSYSMVPETICWRPTKIEEQEGIWIKRGRYRLASKLQKFSARGERNDEHPYNAILTESQDDHGIIALRANHKRSPMALKRCNSFSQPPRSNNIACSEDRANRARKWLPVAHVCPFDGKLRFTCDGTLAPSWSKTIPVLRRCIRGVSMRNNCIQETEAWRENHFCGDGTLHERREWLKELPAGRQDSFYLLDDGRWICTDTWRTVKSCERRARFINEKVETGVVDYH